MDLVTGARGGQAWVAANEEAARRGNVRLVELGGIALRDPIILMAEGDLAFALYRGQLPEPDDPEQRYQAFAFEAFRIRDRQFTEHWDQVRLHRGWMNPSAAVLPAQNAGGRASTAAQTPAATVAAEPPAGCTASAASAAANKALVTRFARARRKGLTRELLIAECDFVAEVWKEGRRDPDEADRMWEAFTFDAFRIRDGRLVEHWDESTFIAR
jgi:predicted SnoaL-like aldol condensation-catalyzing enzyme